MRQGQQNKRGRGRGRRTQNPLARNYESNGPEVKIRGTAAHIAEKYVSLARDSQSAGDHITAENYLQHAEHYNRIIAAAQAQFAPMAQQPASDGPNGTARRDGKSADAEPGIEATQSEDVDAERPSGDGRGASTGDGRGAPTGDGRRAPSGERRRRARNGRDEVAASEGDQADAVQEPGDDASGAAIS